MTVTILKVNHSGEEEAEKLYPYIEECDVFGRESGGKRDDKLKNYEENWQENLAKHSEVEELSLEDKSEYNREIFQYLFINDTPLWIPERFSSREAEIVNPNQNWVEISKVNPTGNYPNVEEMLTHFWELFQANKKITRIRDKNIARNIENAEHKIIERYPSLKGQKEVEYAFWVGQGHEVEKYVDRDVRVEYLADEGDPSVKSVLFEEMSEKYKEGGSFEDLRGDIAAFIAVGVFQIREDLREEFSIQELEEKESNELESLLEDWLERL